MAECRPKNYPKLKDYKPSRFMLPTCHYDAAKADRAVTFIENLRHTKGKWAGKRFWLLPWQEQIIRDVFGIVDERGNRQFRTAYVEIGKKNGKSELAAAVALYLLFADNEPSAEVYGAAADRQQASIVFDVAHQMVQMTPALLKRCKIMAATKRIVNYGNMLITKPSSRSPLHSRMQISRRSRMKPPLPRQKRISRWRSPMQRRKPRRLPLPQMHRQRQTANWRKACPIR